MRGFVAWLEYVVFDVMWYGCFGLVVLGWVGGDSGVCGFLVFWYATCVVWVIAWWFCYLVVVGLVFVILCLALAVWGIG